jgi:hypothetical protein
MPSPRPAPQPSSLCPFPAAELLCARTPLVDVALAALHLATSRRSSSSSPALGFQLGLAISCVRPISMALGHAKSSAAMGSSSLPRLSGVCLSCAVTLFAVELSFSSLLAAHRGVPNLSRRALVIDPQSSLFLCQPSSSSGQRACP